MAHFSIVLYGALYKESLENVSMIINSFRRFSTRTSTLPVLTFVLSSFLLPSLPQQSFAQQYELEEIVVTAQKREEGLQDTPIAISAFTAAAIEDKGIDNIAQIADFTPNLVFDTTAPVSGVSSGAVIFIRGIGITDFALTTDPGVGMYIDGVYASRSVGGVMDVLDIERIEVLRGPQGTLFGRNTIGGALNITSRKPGDELSGSVELTLGEFSRVDFRGSIDIPLSDNFRTNVSVSSKKRDGFVDRVLVGDTLGDENRQSIRFVALYEPSDNWALDFSYDYTKIDEDSAGSVLVGITGNSPTAPQTATDIYNLGFGGALVDPNIGLFDNRFINAGEAGDDRSFGTGLNGTDLDVYGASFTASWAGENIGFKSITAYRETDGSFNRDADNSPIAITETQNPEYNHEQFTQEFQLTGSAFDDRLKYVAGLYFFEEEGIDNVFVPLYGPPGAALLNNLAVVDNSSEAIFLQIDYDFTDALSGTFGVRRTEDEKQFDYIQYVSAPDGGTFAQLPPGFLPGALDLNGNFLPNVLPLVGVNGTGSVGDEYKQTTIKLGLDYKFENSLLYLSYSEGFKSGGFVLRYVQPQPAPLEFEPEEADTIEVGYKWQGWDDRLRVNAAFFQTNYDNVQVTFFDGGGGPVTQNAGEVDMLGFELELTAVISERFQIEAGFGWIDAEYDSIIDTGVPLARAINLDSKLANTPEKAVSLGASYNANLGSNNLVVRADWSYSDDVFNDSQNSPFLFQEAYSTLNASVRLTNASDTWDLILFADNLTDERYIVSGDSNFGLGFHEANYNRPREYGATARYRF